MEQKAQAAEALLARSQGQEALDNAIRAAELYMAAAARADSKQDATRLRRRCQDLITYAEQLKTTITAHPSPRNSILEGASKLHATMQNSLSHQHKL
jgi:calpain-7